MGGSGFWVLSGGGQGIGHDMGGSGFCGGGQGIGHDMGGAGFWVLIGRAWHGGFWVLGAEWGGSGYRACHGGFWVLGAECGGGEVRV